MLQGIHTFQLVILLTMLAMRKFLLENESTPIIWGETGKFTFYGEKVISAPSREQTIIKEFINGPDYENPLWPYKDNPSRFQLFLYGI